MEPNRQTLASSIRSWWRERRAFCGPLSAARQLALIGVQFLRDSLPDRRRQRFGDMDYDWEFRVDTTSANVSWRPRLMGLLNSPYQPIEPELFREMMNSLPADFSQFTFIDVGSGKGRALLLASEYRFQRIIGIELLPELHSIAEENIRKYSAVDPEQSRIETICGDATEFIFPDDPMIVLLNNPLPESGLLKLIGNLENSIRKYHRQIFVVYGNPLMEHVLTGSHVLRKISGTYQFSVFESTA